MKLTIFNGSPRGSKANSNIIIDWFMEGLPDDISSESSIFYLKDQKNYHKMHISIENCDVILMVFPLYTDAMPGIVKKFIDSLGEKNITKGKQFVFIVHSGFTEAIHSRGIERYLERMTGRLRGAYIGTVVKGGSEGIRLMPPWMTKNSRNAFIKIGRKFSSEGILDEISVRKLANPEHLSGFGLIFFQLIGFLGLSNMYWNGMLKKNKAYKLRNDTPYSKF